MTPISPFNLMRARAAFHERLRSLQGDNYHTSFVSSGLGNSMWFAKLRHHNGNHVTLCAWPDKNLLIQRTNHIVTHEGTLYKP